MLYALNRPRPARTTMPVSNAGDFIYDTSGANSILQRAASAPAEAPRAGIGFNVIYTYGKSMDDASSIGGGSPIVVQNPADIAGRVRLVFVRRSPAGSR